MKITRNTLIKVAHKMPSMRSTLLPVIKEGKEFGSKEELEEYISNLKSEEGKKKDEGKKASLRTRVIHLANRNPTLRPRLLKLLAK